MLVYKLKKNIENKKKNPLDWIGKMFLVSVFKTAYHYEAGKVYFKLPSDLRVTCDFGFSEGRPIGLAQVDCDDDRSLLCLSLVEQSLKQHKDVVFVVKKPSGNPLIHDLILRPKLTALKSMFASLVVVYVEDKITLEHLNINKRSLLIVDDITAIDGVQLPVLLSLLRVRTAQCILGTRNENELALSTGFKGGAVNCLAEFERYYSFALSQEGVPEDVLFDPEKPFAIVKHNCKWLNWVWYPDL